MAKMNADIRPVVRIGAWFRANPFVGALLLLCLSVLFHNLGGAALFEPDEGRNAEVAREILLTQDWVTPYYNFTPRLDKPIFFHWLVALSYTLFGVSEGSARLPSALAGLGCILVTYGLARSLLGPWEALWSGLILVTSMEYFVLSRIVILDMALTFFITLSLSAFYWGTETRPGATRKLFYLLMYAAMGVATLIKGPIGLGLPGMVIFFYLSHTKQWSVLREMEFMLGIPLFLIIVAPWYAWVEFKNPGFLRYFLLEENLLRFLGSSFNRTQPWHYFFSVLLIGFLPWTLLIAVIVDDLRTGFLNDKVLFLVLWTTLPLFFFSLSSSKMPHYILPIYPPLSILAAKSVVGLLDDPSGQRRWILSLPWLTLAVSLLAMVLGSLFADLFPDRFPAQLQKVIDEVSPILPYPLIMAIFLALIILALLVWRNSWTKQAYLYLASCVTLCLFFLFIHQTIGPVSRIRSSKELAEKSSAHSGPEDQIVLYDLYLSSIPFYLRVNQPIWIVWSGEKSTIMGSTYVAEKQPQPAPGYGKSLFTFEEFSALWKESKPRLLVFVREKNLRLVENESSVFARDLLKVGDIAVVANR